MYHEIIEFWFSKIDKQQWFTKDQKLDALVRLRFVDLHAQATKCELFPWRSTALGSLSEIVVLDQFSRNMYRDEAESFAHDSLALVLAQSAISRGMDSELTPEQRSFLYMPFMHSESLPIHEEAVNLYTRLGVTANLDFEMKHKAIIAEFGRYPHRNKILGRSSTPEEEEFLLRSDSGF